MPGGICWLVCRVWVGCCRVGGSSAFKTPMVHKRRSIGTPEAHDTTLASPESIARIAVMPAWPLPSGILRGDARAHGLELHMGPCHRRRGCRGPTEVPVGWLHVSYSQTSVSTVPEVGCQLVSSQSKVDHGRRSVEAPWFCECPPGGGGPCTARSCWLFGGSAVMPCMLVRASHAALCI